ATHGISSQTKLKCNRKKNRYTAKPTAVHPPDMEKLTRPIGVFVPSPGGWPTGQEVMAGSWARVRYLTQAWVNPFVIWIHLVWRTWCENKLKTGAALMTRGRRGRRRARLQAWRAVAKEG
ncbi:hypothetical protein, variant, partial [Phytophthora nicotianae P1976]